MKQNINENAMLDLFEDYRRLVEVNPGWKEVADRRNKGHVYGVQKFASKLGLQYPDHDNDKFEDYNIPYVLISLKYNKDYRDKIGIDEKMIQFMNYHSEKHTLENDHHPEFWSKDPKVKDLTIMPKSAIIEMCCDWASVGAENGNSPQSWYNKIKKDLIINEETDEFVLDTLEALWPGGQKETAMIPHEERYFNDNLWKELNKMWDEYDGVRKTQDFVESYDFDDIERMVDNMLAEKDRVKETINKLNKANQEPTVNLGGVGSLQSLSFLFSPTMTNYIMNLIDSVISGNYTNIVDDKVLKGIGLGNLELGNNFQTKAKITNNFANGLLKSLNVVNETKLKNKLLLFKKFMGNLKKFAKSIEDKADRKEYLNDIKSFMKVVTLIKNLLKNRNSFVNILSKTLLMNESSEEIYGDGFVNIYDNVV